MCGVPNNQDAENIRRPRHRNQPNNNQVYRHKI
jgi:hypothetical protein